MSIGTGLIGDIIKSDGMLKQLLEFVPMNSDIYNSWFLNW